MEVLRAAIVWPGNLKKRRTRAKRFVPSLHRAITRTLQTWTRVNSAQLVMPNRRASKRPVFPASKENTTTWKMQTLANFAKQTPIPRTKIEPPNAPPALVVVLP